MKKLGAICLLLCVIFAFTTLTFPAFATQENPDDKSVVSGCRSIDAQVPLLGTEQLITNAKAVILFETNSETLMYAWNADEQLYPASFVKILTALIAIERGSMSDIVTVKKEVLDTVPYDAVSAKLLENEVLTLEQLLYCMMVSSANDAAAVIADHVCGSQSAFVAEMNQYAQTLGCTGTQFTDVHGLNSQQRTTARDIARILAAAMKNEQFRTIFGTVNYTVDATNKSEARHLSTGNYLMNIEDGESYYDVRVTGGRTGTTDDGDRCIAATAQKDGLELISVVMGAKSEYEKDGNMVTSFGGFPETSDLLDRGFDGFQVSQILYSDQVLRQQSVVNGGSDVMMCPQISVSAVLPAGTTVDGLSFRYEDVSDFQAPIEKGQLLSRVEVWQGNLCIAQADLFAMNKVPVLQTQTHADADSSEGDGNWTTVLLVVGIILALLIVLLIGIRAAARLRRAAENSRSRRYRRDRRRSR